MIKLTEEQAQAIEEQKSPLQLLNPRTLETYFLIRKDVYELACAAVGGKINGVWGDDDDDLIP
jgi:hypothetical protein